MSRKDQRGWYWKYIIAGAVLVLLAWVIPGPVYRAEHNPHSILVTWWWVWVLAGLVFSQLLRYVPPRGPR